MVTPVNIIFCLKMDDKPSKRPVGRPRGKVVRHYEVFNVNDIERESILRGDRERLLEATAARASQRTSDPKASKPRKAPKTSTECNTALVKGFGKLAPIIRAHLRNADMKTSSPNVPATEFETARSVPVSSIGNAVAETSGKPALESQRQEWHNRPTLVVCATNTEPKTVSVYNYKCHLASQATASTDTLGYEIFLNGLDEVDDAGVIIKDYNQTLQIVSKGFDLHPEKDQLFADYKKSRTRLDASSNHADRIKASKYTWKAVTECMKKLEEHSRPAFAACFLDDNLCVASSEFSRKLSNYLLAVTGKDLNATLRIVNDVHKNVLVAPKTGPSDFKLLNVKTKRTRLRLGLLEAFKSDCEESTATEIPWKRVAVIGWPLDVPVGFGNLTSNELDKIYQEMVAGNIIFRKH